MKHYSIFLFLIFIIGCSTEDESKRTTGSNKSEWKATISESERKSKVQHLVHQLGDESLEIRQAAFANLLDFFLRKRDIHQLNQEIARNTYPEVTTSLEEIISFIENRWRLPDKGWTDDIKLCQTSWENQFENLGCNPRIYIGQDGLFLEVRIRPENMEEVFNLILTLEPNILSLKGSLSNVSLTDVSFIEILTNLERLDLQDTKIRELPPLKGLSNLWNLNLQNTEVTDLTPLQGLPRLRGLNLQKTGVTDLTPLQDLQTLMGLGLQNTKVRDLTPLKGLKNLDSLYLRNTEVSDITPLGRMPNLSTLDLGKTKVTDLSPLEGLLNLKILYLNDTGVADLTALKESPSLESLYLENTKVTDLTPLTGLTRLTELHIQNTEVTDVTITEQIPDLRIYR